ncbi:hypothetical protein PC121_g9134 [Phytophthora cactorum]|nr:hypothetical protein PC120_g9569 [Phytophthora cactorum]KAG3071784.1 hypothetical protein PC121_g9134 [Phytophthora cactorum]KAG4055365.1 hypothetical protein PC123_g9554 [Phytophthora cactorum]
MQTTLASNSNTEDLVSVPIPMREHTLQNPEECYDGNGKPKRRQHLCTVCSAIGDPQPKGFESSYFCPDCTETFGGYVPLCARVRREESSNTLTYSPIWHSIWAKGTAIPSHLKKRIRFQKRKREEHGESEAKDSSE